MSGKVEQAIDVGDRHLLVARPHLDHRIAGLDNALPEHPEIEPGPMMGDQQSGQTRFAHSHSDAVAGDSRLAHLEQRVPDLKAVSDADLVVSEAFHGEVLTELARGEVIATKFLPPMLVGGELVDHYGAVRSTVPAEITLPVAVDVQSANHLCAIDGVFPHSRVHGLAVPRH